MRSGNLFESKKCHNQVPATMHRTWPLFSVFVVSISSLTERIIGPKRSYYYYIISRQNVMNVRKKFTAAIVDKLKIFGDH